MLLSLKTVKHYHIPETACFSLFLTASSPTGFDDFDDSTRKRYRRRAASVDRYTLASSHDV